MTGKSTISEMKNKNVSTLNQSKQQELTRQLPQTREDRAAAAEEAALR